MIERIWIKNFRMLASNRVDLGRFAVLVGRNASGKSTLMAALRFVSHALSDGVERAVDAALDGSGSTFSDLCFDPKRPIEFALLVAVREVRYRYELEVGALDTSSPPVVLRENLFRLPDPASSSPPVQTSLFGDDDPRPRAAPRGSFATAPTSRWRRARSRSGTRSPSISGSPTSGW